MTMDKKFFALTCIILLFCGMAAHAEPLDYQSTQTTTPPNDVVIDAFNLQKYVLKQNIQLGVDHWAGNFANKNTTGFLDTPDTGHYSDVIPWFKFSGSYLPLGNNDVRLNIDYRYDKTLGGNLDQASLDFSLTPKLGARIGVLPMRLNFCRTYEQDNPWIMEVSTSCKYAAQSIYRTTNAAPGIQLYLNSESNEWASSYQIGFFQPALLGYDKSEFGYQAFQASPTPVKFKENLQSVAIPEPVISQTLSNNKLVINYDGYSPTHGIEFKTGIMWALAKEAMPPPSTGYLVQYPSYQYQYGLTPQAIGSNRYTVFFTGLSIPVTNALQLTPTYNYYIGSLGGLGDAIHAYYQFLPPYQSLAGNYITYPGNTNKVVQNIGLELRYGFSNNSFLTAYYGMSILDSTTSSYLSSIDKKIATLAYRKDLESGFFYIVQGVYGWVTTSASNTPTPAAGAYLGFRLGYLIH